MYSKELMKIMKSYLDYMNFKYDFQEDSGVFTRKMSLDDEDNQVLYWINTEIHSYSVLVSLIDINVNEAIIGAVSEFLNKINFVFPYGHFYIYEDNIICSHRINCNGIIPNHTFIDDCFEKIGSIMEICCKGVIDLINGKGTAKEIFAKYESVVL